MNKLLKYVSMACIALALTACVQDLNTTPIDPNSSTSFNQDRMFTKCYSCLAVIGQSGPGDNSDVEDIDAGTSGFYRTIWYCNELSSDEAWWIWDDKESKQLCQTNWNGTNTMIRAIYTRLVLDIRYCNHYLGMVQGMIDNGTLEKDTEITNRMAEVRFIRALHYFYLLDMYLYSPFLIEDSNEFPHFIPRHQLYEWLTKELENLIVDMPAQRVTKFRVGKAAAQLLLARIYLNANVYNKYNKEWKSDNPYPESEKYAGKNIWQIAEMAANDVINDNPQHSLVTAKIVTDSAFTYSAYQQLFMGDNDRDEVIKESLFQIYQDGLYAQSYATSMMLIGANRLQGLIAWGIESEWHSMRTSPTLVDKFLKPLNIDRETAKNKIYTEYQMPAVLHDDRAILCSDGVNTGYEFTIKGNQDLGDTKYMFDCWAGLKFTGVYSSASLPEYSPRRSKDWPDTDIPLLRLAEAYMIQAEAKFRTGDKAGALEIINTKIRARANADALPDLTDEILLDEWCREFYYEGRRRIDLVRFGRFFGKESDQYRYHWEGRMGKNDIAPAENSPFFVAGTPDYMNWFPIPSEDKRSNPNFKTDVEGDPENTFASEGGDGYTY